MFKKISLIFLIFFPLSIAIAETVGEPMRKTMGRGVYLRWCSQCHGLEGRGDGVNSTPDMAINPRDLTDSTFMRTRSDEQFVEIIKGGGTALAKSPLMPPWVSTLTNEEIKALVGYLRELCECQYEGTPAQNKLIKVDPKFR